ncbi:MAG: 30S ribosomal protein S3 [Nanobdellota archaeon]
MIERKILQQKIKGYLVEDYVSQALSRVGHSHTTISRNPLGEKICIYASRPGLVVGSKGSNIKKLTKVLKAKFKLENPQIEIEEVKDASLDPRLVAENIASSLERFGTTRFKGVGYKAMDRCLKAGAQGIEILITGKIPSSRSKRWRFYMGYLKKCGDVSVENVKSAYDVAKLKIGVIGIQVRIMPPDLVLPDSIQISDKLNVEVQDVTDKEPVEQNVDKVKKEAEEVASEESKSKNQEVIENKAKVNTEDEEAKEPELKTEEKKETEKPEVSGKSKKEQSGESEK